MVIQLGLDSTSMNDSLTKAKNQLRNFEKQIKSQGSLANFYKTGTNAALAYTKQKELLNKAIQTQSQVLQKLKKDYDDEVEKSGAMSKKAQSLAGDIENANGKLIGYAAQLRNVAEKQYLAQSSLVNWSNEFKGAGRILTGFSGQLDVLSQKTAGLSFAIFGGMYASAKAAMDYESAFTGVTKTVDEVVDKNGKVIYSYDELSKGIRGMALELPASAVEIAKVAEVAGQLGIATEKVLSFSKVMIDLGESTNLTSEEAATMIARYANITQLDPSKYENLGSVIVDLGNNTATTEKDITEMALRLASTGKLVGLSDDQIMALAATMSSLGMKSEAGGSAMSRVMQKINTGVAEGEEALDNYAKTAGMASEEFAKLWKNRPEKALIALSDGLARVKREGGDVTQTLKDMGIKNIREIDSMQRLAGSGKLLADNLDLASGAWKNNTALSIEANKRYATTESKMKMVKNKVTDLAIEIGGPLLDAFMDILDIADPFITGIGDMAEKFSKLDKNTQQQIINMALMAGAISPVSKGLSILTGVLGGTSKGLGTLLGAFAKIGAKQAGADAIASIETLAGGMAGATSSATGLSGALGGVSAITLPQGALVVGILAVAGAVAYFAHEAAAAEERAQTWGTKVDRVQAQELSNFKNKVDDTKKAMTDFASGAVEEVDDIKESFENLVDEIAKLTDKELAKDLDIAKKFGLSAETQQAMKDNASRFKQETQQLSDEVIAIYQKHKNNSAALSEEEKTIVLNAQNELIERRLKLENYSSSEILSIRKAMNGDLSEMNRQQAQNWRDTTKKWLDEEKSSYKENHDALKEAHDNITGTDQASLNAKKEIYSQMETLESDHNAKMDAYKTQHLEALKQWYKESLKTATSQEAKTLLNANLNKFLAEIGVSYDEFMQQVNFAQEKSAQTASLLGKDVEGMGSKMKEANDKWRGLIWDEKTASVKTNAAETLKESVKTEQGWNDLVFVLKNANIDSNARQMIVEAIQSTGKWNGLTVDAKQLIVDGNQAMIEIATSDNLLKSWNTLTPGQKLLLARDLTKNPTQSAQKAIDSVKQQKPADINASDKTGKPVGKAMSSLGQIVDKWVSINANDNASGAVDWLQKKLNDLVSREYSFNVSPKMSGFEHGTDYYQGGLAMVNDQKGPLYKELVTLPTGESFIPEGRDVVLPLPKGSKVLTASKTKRLMGKLGIPRFEGGLGIPEDALIFRQMEKAKPSNSVQTVVVKQDNKDLAILMNEVIRLLKQRTNQEPNIIVQVGDSQISDVVTKRQKRAEMMNNRMKGVLST